MINGVKFGPSRSGKDMLTFDCTIVGPEVVNENGIEYTTGGVGFTMWTILEEKSLQTIVDKATALGVPDFEEECSTAQEEMEAFANSIINYLENKVVTMLLTCEPDYALKTQTPEQAAAGERPDPLLDDNGQKVINRFNIRSNFTGIRDIANVMS
jgi:hypothetical protein